MSFIKFAQGKGWISQNDDAKSVLFPVSLERFLEYAKYQLERADGGFIRYQSATDYLTQLNYTHRLLNLDWTEVYNHHLVAQIRDEIFSKHKNSLTTRKRKSISNSPRKSPPKKTFVAVDTEYDRPQPDITQAITLPTLSKLANTASIVGPLKTGVSLNVEGENPAMEALKQHVFSSTVKDSLSNSLLPGELNKEPFLDQNNVDLPSNLISDLEEHSASLDLDESRESIDVNSAPPSESLDVTSGTDVQEYKIFLVGENSTGLDGGNNYLRFAQNQGLVSHFKDWRSLFPIPIENLISYLEFLASEKNTRVRGVTTVRKYIHDIKKLHVKLGYRDWESINLANEKVDEKIGTAEKSIEKRTKADDVKPEQRLAASTEDLPSEVTFVETKRITRQANLRSRESSLSLPSSSVQFHSGEGVHITNAKLRVAELESRCVALEITNAREKERIAFVKELLMRGTTPAEVASLLKMV